MEESIKDLNQSIIELNKRIDNLHWLSLHECTVGVFVALLTIDIIGGIVILICLYH